MTPFRKYSFDLCHPLQLYLRMYTDEQNHKLSWNEIVFHCLIFQISYYVPSSSDFHLKVSYGILVIAFAKSKVPIFSVAKFSMNNLQFFFAYDQIIVRTFHLGEMTKMMWRFLQSLLKYGNLQLLLDSSRNGLFRPPRFPFMETKVGVGDLTPFLVLCFHEHLLTWWYKY